VLKFSKCLKKAIFSQLFFFFNGTFSAAPASFPRESSYPNSKLNASTMGGQRKGSLKERSELEFSNQRKQLLNLAIFEREIVGKSGFSWV